VEVEEERVPMQAQHTRRLQDKAAVVAHKAVEEQARISILLVLLTQPQRARLVVVVLAATMVEAEVEVTGEGGEGWIAAEEEEVHLTLFPQQM